MCASTVLNYMDRQAIALVGPEVKAQFGLDNLGFGWALAAFQLSYAFFQWPAGYLADRWDVRRTYAGAVLGWSLAGIATAFAPTLGVFLVFRAILGMGESFNWPCALRVTAGVLPPADRSLGNGIFNSGAAIGAVLTPLCVAPLAAWLGWRSPFLLLGLGGLIWVAVWLPLSRGPGLSDATPPQQMGRNAGLSRSARYAFLAVLALAAATALSGFYFGLPAVWWGIAVLMIGLLIAALVLDPRQLEGADWASSLGDVVRQRKFWVIAVVGITINVTWHFLVNWIAIFFQEERRLGLLVGGMVTSLPFLAAGLGNLGGGALTRLLARRGMTTTGARKLIMTCCLVLVCCAVWVGFAELEPLIIFLLCLTAFGAAAYMVNYFAFAQDVLPRHTGLVIGYLGGLGNLFAAGFMPLAGYLSRDRGFAPSFLIVGLLPLAGLVVLLSSWGNDESKSA
jgi:ACS family hexuronate transporter-like MFS transporter